MSQSKLFVNLRYYSSYQLLFVCIFIILSSIGAFFHFLLDHEISIVESWLHNNHWEVLILAKIISLFLLNRWFKMRLYELRPIRELIKEFVKAPEPKAIIISVFMFVSYLSLGRAEYIGHNLGYWYYHFTSYIGLFLYFGIEFIVIAYLDDILNDDLPPSLLWLSLSYTAIFTVGFRLSIPDYYELLPYIILCFLTLMYLSGKSFKNWSNVVCFLCLFVAPMGSLLGLDPVWGDDFSPFRMKTKLGLPFLAVIWMISFFYYKYRDHIFHGIRKLIR